MIDLEMLVAVTSEEAVDEARNAMDLTSVSSFRYDTRGRLEGGIKPAPPSTEPSSYTRITKRGSTYLVDCMRHGKQGWCLHALILALHHLGQKPSYRVAHTKNDKPAEPRAGFQLVLELTTAGGLFRIRALSTGQYLVNPLRFLLREWRALAFSERARELFEDLAEEETAHFLITRIDLASALAALESEVEVFHPKGEPYRVRRGGEPPCINAGIQGNHVYWEGGDPQSTYYLPGWPGYVCRGLELQRPSGYVPDFQTIAGKAEGSVPLTAANLAPLLLEKHGIVWQSSKPHLLTDPATPGLRLEANEGQLMGRLGVWHGDSFLPLNNLDETLQLLSDGNHHCLLRSGDWQLSQWRAGGSKLRAPWNETGTRFTVRESAAPAFLKNMARPRGFRIEREAADHWFGTQKEPVTVIWPAGEAQPEYRVGAEVYSHQQLVGQLSADGARLTDGRQLNFDTTPVRHNEKILAGIGAIHGGAEAAKDLLRRIVNPESEINDAQPPLPDLWQTCLRDYQISGVQWLLANHRRNEPSLLADDMGLGKTVQALAFLDIIRGDKPQLIVAPTSLLFNWQAEIQKFCPHRTITLHHGPKRTTSVEEMNLGDLVLTSYGTLRQDEDLLYDVAFEVVVLDEAQAIKNPTSRTAKVAFDLWSEHRLALTGTPIENRLTELWSIFRFLAPGYLGEEDEIKAIGLPGSAAYGALKAKVAPFLKRRLKQEVEQDLPPKQEITVSLPLSRDQVNLYESYRRHAHDKKQKGNTVSLLTQLLRLRQICCHPGLVDERYLKAESNKLSFLLESLTEVVASGHAALVFSQFTSLLRLVAFALEEEDHAYLYLDGKTTDRAGVVNRFQDGAAPVFLISLKAGGTGLNLTRASYVYHLDPWWNPMAEAQATDRAHRIGQARKVISYKLISEGTVEERILRLQAGKRFLAEGLWADPEQLIGKLDHETLLALLS